MDLYLDLSSKFTIIDRSRSGSVLVFDSNPLRHSGNAMKISSNLEKAITQSRMNRNDVLIIPEFNFENLKRKLLGNRGERPNKVDELRIQGILSHDLLRSDENVIETINPLIDGYSPSYDRTYIISQPKTKRGEGFRYLLISPTNEELTRRYIEEKGLGSFLQYK